MSVPAGNVPPLITDFDQRPAAANVVQHIIDSQQIPSATRLAAAHQRVTLRNTDERQTHFIQDRSLKHIELRPGESKELDMLTSELANLINLSRNDRGYYESGPKKGAPFPLHPVRVIGLGAKVEAAVLK
jgi:hypothetical protein